MCAEPCAIESAGVELCVCLCLSVCVCKSQNLLGTVPRTVRVPMSVCLETVSHSLTHSCTLELASLLELIQAVAEVRSWPGSEAEVKDQL